MEVTTGSACLLSYPCATPAPAPAGELTLPASPGVALFGGGGVPTALTATGDGLLARPEKLRFALATLSGAGGFGRAANVAGVGVDEKPNGIGSSETVTDEVKDGREGPGLGGGGGTAMGVGCVCVDFVGGLAGCVGPTGAGAVIGGGGGGENSGSGVG